MGVCENNVRFLFQIGSIKRGIKGGFLSGTAPRFYSKLVRLKAPEITAPVLYLEKFLFQIGSIKSAVNMTLQAINAAFLFQIGSIKSSKF